MESKPVLFRSERITLISFHPAERPGEAIVAMEKIGLVDAAEVFVKMGDTGVVGAFKIEDHGRARALPDELVEQKMIGFGCPAGWQGSGMEQIIPGLIPQEHGGTQGLPCFIKDCSDQQLVPLLQRKA